MLLCKFCNQEGKNTCLIFLNSPLNKNRNLSWKDLLIKYQEGSVEAETELSIRFCYFCCSFISQKYSGRANEIDYMLMKSVCSGTYETIIENDIVNKCISKIVDMNDKDKERREIEACLGTHLKQSYYFEKRNNEGTAKYHDAQDNILSYLKMELKRNDIFDYNQKRDFFNMTKVEESIPDIVNMDMDKDDFYEDLCLHLKGRRIENISRLITEIYDYYRIKTGSASMRVERGNHINISDAVLKIRYMNDIYLISIDDNIDDNKLCKEIENENASRIDYLDEIDIEGTLGNLTDEVLSKRRYLSEKERSIRKEFLMDLFLENMSDEKSAISLIGDVLRNEGLDTSNLKRIQDEIYYDKQKIETLLIAFYLEIFHDDYPELKDLLGNISRIMFRNKDERSQWVDRKLKRYKSLFSRHKY